MTQSLEEIIKELNIPPEKLQEMAQRMSANPMAAMSMVQELNIPPEAFQKMIAAVLANPSSILEMAKKFGVDDKNLQEVEDRLSSIQSGQKPENSDS